MERGPKLSRREEEEARKWGAFHPEDWEQEKEPHYSEKGDHKLRSISNSEQHRSHFKYPLDKEK